MKRSVKKIPGLGGGYRSKNRSVLKHFELDKEMLGVLERGLRADATKTTAMRRTTLFQQVPRPPRQPGSLEAGGRFHKTRFALFSTLTTFQRIFHTVRTFQDFSHA